ncbi:unnamed protein product [Phytophthora fragariaefolia]|uniref:Unnamed protein product n=1 Tax=Phytophthora fragariaefolia TaxID=1490495 RepID=A0A9W6XCD0_9STRA|nr:unnamed protein product [Phytophthora fragariaefolia]
MNAVLCVTCLIYLDNIVVLIRGGIERHVVELTNGLVGLAPAGQTLKLKKCLFTASSVEYLGHKLSRDGARPLSRPVTAVQEFPRPTDVVKVWLLVHLAVYYRRFEKVFGSIMAPITRRLRKDVKWTWTHAQAMAFELVKTILTTKHCLIYPSFKLLFRVVTDESAVGLGACLLQNYGNGWQPVAYASKVNNTADSKCGIRELEWLAVVWTIKCFRPYLYGRRFTNVTDHSALKWFMTSSNLTGKLIDGYSPFSTGQASRTWS